MIKNMRAAPSISFRNPCAASRHRKISKLQLFCSFWSRDRCDPINSPPITYFFFSYFFSQISQMSSEAQKLVKIFFSGFRHFFWLKMRFEEVVSGVLLYFTTHHSRHPEQLVVYAISSVFTKISAPAAGKFYVSLISTHLND